MNETIEDIIASIQNDTIRTLAEASVAAYAALLRDGEGDIKEALAQAANDEGERLPLVRVAHAVVIDLNKMAVKDTISTTIKHSHEAVTRLRDPNQPELFEGGEE